MDSKFHDDEDDNKLVFQDLTPENSTNAFQKSIIHIQHNWHKRHLFTLLTILSGILIVLFVFKFLYPLIQPPNKKEIFTLTTTIDSVTIKQVLPYHNVIYVDVHQATNDTNQLDALNAKTGALVWNDAHQNVRWIQIFGDMLCIQTDTSLMALNADTRTLLWMHPISNHATYVPPLEWKIDQGILFVATTQGTVTALDASTGVQLWDNTSTSQNRFWQVDNGIFYTNSASGLELSAFDAHTGQQLWSKEGINPGSTTNGVNINQDLTIDSGRVYLQNSENQNIQAFDGRNGKLLWQLNTHKTDFYLVAHDGFLILSDAQAEIQKTHVETLDGQTGKILWQHQGTLAYLLGGSPIQAIISSTQKNEIDVIRINDGTTLYHFSPKDIPNVDNMQIETLFSIENGIAIFMHYSQGNGVQYPQVIAVRISTGATLWSSQVFDQATSLQNGVINIVPIGDNALLSLRADSGYTLWKHTFDTTNK